MDRRAILNALQRVSRSRHRFQLVVPTDQPLPVTHSVLSTQALCTEMVAAYGLRTPLDCKLLSPGLNDTYLVTTAADRFILRIYRVGWRSHSDILYEIDVLNHLGRKGASVSLPLATAKGDFTLPLRAPEGLRYAVLFTYAPGQSVDELDDSYCRLFGGAVGEMHRATGDFTSQHERFALDLEYLIERPLRAIRPLLENRSEDWSHLQSLAQRLQAALAQAPLDVLDWGFCHGDLHTENAHLAGDTLTFFDFDCGGPGWRAYDIAGFRWSLNNFGRRVVPEHEHLWQAFLDGYAERRRIGTVDLEFVPAFVEIRHIWMIGLHAENAPDFGYERFSDSYFDGVLRFLRDWEQTYL